MLHRYHNIEYILQTEADIGTALILKALEQEQDDRLYQQWVAQLPMMAFSGKAIGFADYKSYVTGANIDRRSTADILAELEDVEKELQRGGTG